MVTEPNVNPINVRATSWSLWTRQVLAILRLEIKKNFLSRRAFLLYLIAGMPLVLLSMLALFPPPTDEMENFSQLGQVYAGIYGGLILRTLIFFGCAWVFMNLFRGEVVDRSLHYYFLSPVRREVLLVGKYLSGLIATIVLFSITTLGSILILYFWLFPATMINVYPWGLSVNLVEPRAPDATRVRFRTYVWDERHLDRGAGANLFQVELEDERVVESVQRGLAARLRRSGRYSPARESGVHHFHRLLARALADGSPG